MKQFQKTDYGTTFKGMSVKTKKSPHSKNPDQNRVNEPAQAVVEAQYVNKHTFPGQSPLATCVGGQLHFPYSLSLLQILKAERKRNSLYDLKQETENEEEDYRYHVRGAFPTRKKTLIYNLTVMRMQFQDRTLAQHLSGPKIHPKHE